MENNKTKEFRITDIVQNDDRAMRSAERNETVTPGRLVKLKPATNASESDPVASEGDNVHPNQAETES